MPRTLITLVSPQTLPAVLFIKQFGPFDRYIFLSTKKMENNKVTKHIIGTCGLRNNIKKVKIDPDRMYQVIETVRKIAFHPDEEIMINITGGTKMMAMGTHAELTKNADRRVKVYYIPFPSKVVYEIYPSNEEYSLTEQVTLHEYLQAYGVRVVEEERIAACKNRIGLCEKLFAERCKGKVPYQILNSVKSDYKEVDKKFLSGAWFEIWLGNRIQTYFDLQEDEIRINMKLSRAPEDSDESTEYDVVYIRNNKLFIGECKYFPKGKFKKSKINKDWYKLAGLKLQMGLNATPFLITANKLDDMMKGYMKETHELFGIRGFADITTISQKNRFHQFLDEL